MSSIYPQRFRLDKNCGSMKKFQQVCALASRITSSEAVNEIQKYCSTQANEKPVYPIKIAKTNFFTTRHPKKKFSEKHLKTSSKHVWTLLGTFLDIFKNLKVFRFFFNLFLSLDLPGCTRQKFFRKNHLKRCSKHVWTFLVRFLNIFRKFFD